MNVTITTESGTFEGRTLQSAARRGHGKRVVVHSAPAGSDHVGVVFDPTLGDVATIFRVEGLPIEPLTETEVIEVANLLEGCMNWTMAGFLSDDGRARLYALIEQPNQQTWSDAYSLILTDPAVRSTTMTLWQLVLASSHYDCRKRRDSMGWTSIPMRSEVLAAVRRAVTFNQAALTSESAR